MGSVCPHMGCPDFECYEESFRKAWLRKGIIMTEWFVNDGSGVAVHAEDPNLAIVGDYIPDWVRVPAESPERGGEQLRVTGHINGTCPKCRANACRILQLEHGFYVAQCKPGCGFVFYKVG